MNICACIKQVPGTTKVEMDEETGVMKHDGIGFAKKPYRQESIGEPGMGLLAGIKQAFDPKNILNPGKVCT